ncbi:MAG: response regulator [Elusimicrobiaceae bacterium]
MNKIILVVDDNPTHRKLIRVLLAGCGYSVYEAETGRQALERVRACAPDLIVLDYRLPDINGVEVSRNLKAESAYVSIPIIMVSALSVNEMSARIVLNSTCAEYMTKPIDVHTLVSAVQRHIGRA